MQGVSIDFHPPDGLLELIKAFLDFFTVIAFMLLLAVIIYAARRYPMIERRRTFYPLLIFAVFGIVSSAMDAFDEWFWFTPGEFYDYIWKPTRLWLFLIGIFLLVIAFSQFYDFSRRLFGEEDR
jgi:hypothetical protein